MTTMEREGGVMQVIAWARFPRTVKDLYEVLDDTTDDELLALMRDVGGPSGRIAWAEWGRRKHGVPFAVSRGVATPQAYLPSQVWS